jgi:probable HAF family extracellular repeat protein
MGAELHYSRRGGIMTGFKFAKKSKNLMLLLFSLLLFSIHPVHAQTNYELIDLGTHGYDSSYASSINNNGVVAGTFNYQYAFRWIDGLGFQVLEGFGSAIAKAINDKNELSGELLDFNDTPAPFVWYEKGLHILFYPYHAAESINNNSQLVLVDWEYTPISYFWKNGKYTLIVNPGIGNAINDSGQVVGTYFRGEGREEYAFFWEDDIISDLNDLVPGGFENHLSGATDINTFSQIIGALSIDPSRNPFSSFLFVDGQVTDIGFRGALAINDSGQIVGSHYIYQDGQSHDLQNLIETGTSYSDLYVRDINNTGQIVGSAIIDGSMHAVLLNPTSSKSTFGHEEVFSLTSVNRRRSAMPFAMPEDGTIDSVAIFHEGGSGDMLLAVYGGEILPDNRLAVTMPTAVKSDAGWQIVNLTDPVFVPEGAQIWLAWVFENNPGVRYRRGSPGRSRSNQKWHGGMPISFGASSQNDYIYSIYAMYTYDGK